jgi:hydroxymethylpyrimidine kinase / phosphomethylpyrimidine kinase / thiamine-phosphate diphosphorylase
MMKKFKDCGNTPLGLYPIIDSLAWLEKLLPTGVTTFQLRIKNKNGIALENEIQKSINLARRYNARLFINDYWELAIFYGAYGVHLGQSDLDQADVGKICQAGLRLGLSSYCDEEIARADALKPSYLACGPVFPTTSKIVPFAPQGIEQLKRWQRTLDYPLVAIGGINSSNLADVIATKVNGIAMISAITQTEDPIATTQKFLAMIHEGKTN